MRKFIITKLTLDGPSKRKKTRTTVDLMSRVFSDRSKEDLIYYLAEELTKKKLVILDINIREVTP